ncbi:MAG: metallophosphoesterase [Reichenbachiella sp.]
MNRITLLLLFFFLYIYVDYYVFQSVRSLVTDSALWVRIGSYSLYWGMTLVGIALIVLWPRLATADYEVTRGFLFTGFAMNVMGKLVTWLVLFGDVIVRGVKKLYVGLIHNGSTEQIAEGLTRSDFLTKSAFVAGAIPISLMSYGVVSGAYDFRVRRKQIPIKGLPKAFDGLKIAQLSDIHSGSFYNKKAVRGGIEMMMAEKPDLFLFTGDLVNNESAEVRDYQDIFSKAKAPLGQFSVLGNHDYGDYKQWASTGQKQKNLSDLITVHKQMGWDILMNENRHLEIDGERLALIGVENWGKGSFAKYGDLNKAMSGVEADAQILLSHDPSHWDAQVRGMYPDIDLTLSGHTHGFQFGVEIGDFRWSPSQYLYKQWADLYTENNQHLYVNRGFGFLGFPGRIGILPEIAMLELKRV